MTRIAQAEELRRTAKHTHVKSKQEESFTLKSEDAIPAQLLKECLKIYEKRGAQYGDSAKNFSKTAHIVNSISPNKNGYSAMDVVVVMVAVKFARYKYQYQLWKSGFESFDEKVLHDSIVDAINYLCLLEDIRVKI